MSRRPLTAALAVLQLVCAAGGASGCGERAATLDVYVAASMREAVEELAVDFQSEHGVELRLNTGSSGWLAVQIQQASGCDVFLSAGVLELERLVRAELVEPGTRVELCSNQLVLIAPRGTGASGGLELLADASLTRLSIADPDAVPAGRYARAWLESAGLWQALEPRLLPGTNVRAALAAVESGAAELGVVYATDAALSERVEVVHTIATQDGPPIAYVGAVLRGRERAVLARAFLTHLASERARAVLRRHGFVVAEGG